MNMSVMNCPVRCFNYQSHLREARHTVYIWRFVEEADFNWQGGNSVLGCEDALRTFLLLFFLFSKAAGGGRETLYAVKKNQIPKKPPAMLGGFFCTACYVDNYSGVKLCPTIPMICVSAKSRSLPALALDARVSLHQEVRQQCIEPARPCIASCTAWTTGWPWSSVRARSTTPAALEYAAAPARPARPLQRRAGNRHARVLREAAHHGGLERADQRSRPRRQLQHQQGPAHRPRTAAGDQRASACPRAANSST